jgi:hypothetical protein
LLSAAEVAHLLTPEALVQPREPLSLSQAIVNSSQEDTPS